MPRLIALAAMFALACNGKKTPTADADPDSTDVPVEPDTEAVKADAEDGDTLIAPPPPEVDSSLAIVGTRWELRTVDGEAVAAPADQSVLYFQIDPGTPLNLNGYAGCNRFFGTATTVTDDTVSFGNVGSTRRACPALGQEQVFLRILGEVNRWSIAADTLSLSVGDNVRLTFARGADIEAEFDLE